MNDEMKNTNPNGIEKKLLDVAERTNANPQFVSELESKLKDIHKPQTSWSMPMFKQATSALGWIALVAMLGYFLNWSFATLIPTQQPGANTTPDQFVCPVTQPNGSLPPYETVESPYYFGNGEIWTGLWSQGKVYMLPENREPDNSFSMKWWWWRAQPGEQLTIEGHRLDANADPLRAEIPDGYADYFQVAALIFPTTGCWEVTGRVGASSLTFVTEVVFGEATPVPDISTQAISTPDPNRPGFDFRGAKLILNTTLPESPAQANIYTLRAAQPVTAEYAQTLAKQFGIASELYRTQRDYPIAPGFMATDGKQQLVVFGENDYTYIADLVKNSRTYTNIEHKNAQTTILDYLKSHGLDSGFSDVQASSTFGGYVLRQISPDGLPMQYESFSQPAMRVTLAADGSILSVTTTPLIYERNPVGSYGIISAEAAFQKLLDDTLPAGKIEISHSGAHNAPILPQTWYHEYPDNQTVSLTGYVQARAAVDSNKPAVIFLDNIQVIGNTSGLEAFQTLTLIQATGQFVIDNDVRKFNVDSWNKNVQPAFMTGSARREGKQVIFVNGEANGTEYTLVDPPVDLPLNTSFPASSLISEGALVDGKLYWTSILYYADSSQMGGGGGGGGSGIGFYQLNLSGSPIAFPTATPVGITYSAAEIASFLRYTVQPNDTMASIATNYEVSVDDLMHVNNLADSTVFTGEILVIPGVPGPTRVDGEHGTVLVTYFQKPDGRKRTQYAFFSEKDLAYYELKGDNLEALQKVAYRPVALWGSISFDQFGAGYITVEKFEELYPGLQDQLLTGTQTTQTASNGESLVLFTTNGVTYVQMALSGGYPDGNFMGDNVEVAVRGILVPGETYAGYPTLRVTVIGFAVNPVTGERQTLDAISNETIPDPFGNADAYIPPDILIDKVELVYFVSNPANNTDTSLAPNASYIQPAWSFTGHSTNSDIVNFLIQALQQEYLSPEITSSIPPG